MMSRYRVQGILLALTVLLAAGARAAERVRIDSGTVEGAKSADLKVRIFKGIPYAAPPVGDLRWRPPQTVAHWKGVRKATAFGARCMQGNVFSDMVFRDPGPSEDCLYLNVWTPAATKKERLPVMVWIYGGGFAAGSSSEPRQDGENLAKKGVVVVSCNYRLGLFGFYAHPDLTAESPHHASGNYGLLDQVAALEWVHRNIAAFGGDPAKVTIFGESAGSFSVSALMASPLAQGLFRSAIGESGAFFSATLHSKTLATSERDDQKFAESLGADSIAAMRAKPAGELLQAAMKEHNIIRFAPNVDGYFLPQDVPSIFAAGKQSHVPLLAGWNADEGGYDEIFRKEAPTAANFVDRVRALYDGDADALLKVYPAATDDEAKRSAQDLAGDRFTAFSTWKWIEMQAATGGSPVYRYEFDDAPPNADGSTEPSPGAYHSAEIEFVFEALASKHLPWRPEDETLSDRMSSYWSNFAKTGDPNGPGLPQWPAYTPADQFQVMHLSATPHSEPDEHRTRYEVLDSISSHP